MEVKFELQRSAKRWSLASLLIALGTIPFGIGVAWILSYSSFDSSLFFFITMLAVSLAGFVIGVIGLLKSIRKQSHTTKGIVLSSIGILLNVLILCGTLLVSMIVDAVSQPLI